MTEISPKRAGQKLRPTSKFKYAPDSIKNRTLSDFWQWAYSDLMQNIERGVLAEYIVAVLLGVNDQPRIPWTAYDLKLSNGKTVEVKTMSQLQAWYQRRLSNPRVVIKPTRKWDPETNVMEKKPKFHADLYVICYFNADSHDLADPLNLAQWEFYAFNRRQVEKMLEGRKSISLKYLEKLGINPIKAHELREHILRNSE